MATLRLAVDSRPAEQGVTALRRQVTQTREELGRFVKTTDQAERQTTLYGRASATAGRFVGDLRQRFSGFNGALSRTAGLLTGIVGGLTLVAGARGGISTIAGYEQSLVTLQGVARATTLGLSSLESQSRELGASTRFTAQEAAEGQLFLARAGFEVRQILDALPATLDLAQVGMLELGESADLASNVIKQFGLNADEATRVVDALVITSNRSNTDVRQLGEALKYAGPIANAFGESVESTAAAIGVLGDAGIQASLAGTNLRGVLAALGNETPKLRRTLGELGLEFQSIDPSANSLADIFERLQVRGLSASQALEIFGRRNAAAALVLADSTTRMRELEEATSDYEGEASRIARLQEQTLIGQFKALKSALQEAALATGDSGLLGELKDLTAALTQIVRVTTDASQGFDDLTDTAKTTAVAVAGIFLPVGRAVRVASAALLIFRNRLVTIEGQSVSVAQAVGAVASEVADRIGLVFSVLERVGLQAERAVLSLLPSTLDFLDDVQRAYIQFQVFLGNLDPATELSLKTQIALDKIVRDVQIASRRIELDTQLATLNRRIGELTAEQGSFWDAFIARTREAGEENVLAVQAGLVAVDAAKIAMIGFWMGAGDAAAGNSARVVRSAADIEAQLESLEGEAPSDGGAVSLFFRAIAAAAEDSADRMARINLEEQLRRAEELGRGFAGALGRPLFDLLTARAGLDEFFASLLRNIADTATQLLIVQPLLESLAGTASASGPGTGLAGFFQGLFSAKGNVFSGGSHVETFSRGSAMAGGSALEAFSRGAIVSGGAAMQSFADGAAIAGGRRARWMGLDDDTADMLMFGNGAIVTRPTVFPMPDRRVGMMGEAGEEAIMPLTRIGGRLGVVAEIPRERSFTRERSSTTTVLDRGRSVQVGSVDIHVYGATDADSFRRSRRQLVEQLRDELDEL